MIDTSKDTVKISADACDKIIAALHSYADETKRKGAPGAIAGLISYLTLKRDEAIDRQEKRNKPTIWTTEADWQAKHGGKR